MQATLYAPNGTTALLPIQWKAHLGFPSQPKETVVLGQERTYDDRHSGLTTVPPRPTDEQEFIALYCPFLTIPEITSQSLEDIEHVK